MESYELSHTLAVDVNGNFVWKDIQSREFIIAGVAGNGNWIIQSKINGT